MSLDPECRCSHQILLREATQRLGELIDDWFSQYLGHSATNHIKAGKQLVIDDGGKEPPDIVLYRRMWNALPPLPDAPEWTHHVQHVEPHRECHLCVKPKDWQHPTQPCLDATDMLPDKKLPHV